MNKIKEFEIGNYLVKIIGFGGIALLVDLICFIPLKTALTTNQLDFFLIGSPIFFMILGFLSELSAQIKVPDNTKRPWFAFKFAVGISIIGAFILLYPSQLFRNMHITAAIVSVIAGLFVGTCIFSLFNLGGIAYKNLAAGCIITVLLAACVFFYLYVITLGSFLLLLLFMGIMGFGMGSQ